MVTAELAAALPVLMVVLAVALSAVNVAGARVRVQDAAREAARAAARGDSGAAAALAARAAPGVTTRTSVSGPDVEVRASLRVRLLAHWLPSVTVTEQAVAAVEPGQPTSGSSGPPGAAPVPP